MSITKAKKRRIATADDLLPRPRRVRRLRGSCAPKFFRNVTFCPGRGPNHLQGYLIRIEPDRIVVAARDKEGMKYAEGALASLMERGSGGIACMHIEDWPDFAVRGVMLDISRDKVPTMATLRGLVDSLARLRINQLQLYIEHTFAYRCHERVWRGASPMTGGQIESLDRYSRRRGVELVPNQNSFGHMERWLKYAPYSQLAEAVGPWRTPWGTVRTAPTTLNPLDPRSLLLMRDLYDQLLPQFSSGPFNVGCDETFELGQGRSAAVCRRRGVGRVYFEYLMKLHREVRRRGRRMMFWSDIIHEHPEVIKRLPRDVIPLVWGYEANHPFDRQCREIKRRGLEFYVCPGTSSWCSFSGRSANAKGNLLNAARAGRQYGATGYLITDWGDYGHRQYLPASYAGFIYGASVSWCAKANEKIDVGREVGRHFFGHDKSELGPFWFEAGRLHEPSEILLKNRTILFTLMETRLGEIPSIKGLTRARLKAMRSEIERLAKKVGAKDSKQLARDELVATLQVLHHACARGELALSRKDSRERAAVLRKLSIEMSGIIARHRQLWLARNRPGGLASSISYFDRALAEYEPRGRKRSTNLK